MVILGGGRYGQKKCFGAFPTEIHFGTSLKFKNAAKSFGLSCYSVDSWIWMKTSPPDFLSKKPVIANPEKDPNAKLIPTVLADGLDHAVRNPLRGQTLLDTRFRVFSQILPMFFSVRTPPLSRGYQLTVFCST